MGRKQPLGRKHKAGTGNMKDAPAARIISKAKVSFATPPTGATLQARCLPLSPLLQWRSTHASHCFWFCLQASSSVADAAPCKPGFAESAAAQLPRQQRPKSDELGAFRVSVLTRGPDGHVSRPRAEVHAEFAEKNTMCTCSSGVPSFLCRAVQCYAFEIGMCDPEIGHWDWYRRGKHPSRCDCIPWEKIRDDPYDVKCLRACEEEGDSLSELDSISARRNGRARGRLELCQHCDGAGTYIRTCNAYGHWDGELGEGVPMRMGRSVMAVGDDVALVCIVRCKGHQGGRSCDMHNWPDVVVDRRGSSVPISRNMGV